MLRCFVGAAGQKIAINVLLVLGGKKKKKRLIGVSEVGGWSAENFAHRERKGREGGNGKNEKKRLLPGAASNKLRHNKIDPKWMLFRSAY